MSSNLNTVLFDRNMIGVKGAYVLSPYIYDDV